MNKKVGELSCEEVKCIKCPLYILCEFVVEFKRKETLFASLDSLALEEDDNELYHFFLDRLMLGVEE